MMTKLAFIALMLSSTSLPFNSNPVDLSSTQVKAPMVEMASEFAQPVSEVTEAAKTGAPEQNSAIESPAVQEENPYMINADKTAEECMVEAFDRVYKEVNAKLAQKPRPELI